jgi:RHS repeat-associated protein
VKTTFPDDTLSDADNPVATVEYDKVGRKLAEVDEMGRRKELEYDGLGRLVAVRLPNPHSGLIDSGALVTRYGYDDVGNKTSQTDALNRVTRWTYDKMGRELTRTLPLGQTESFGYDDAGQRTSHTDFNGVTTRYGYDAAGRMDVLDYATDADVITTYTASGQRESVTDGQGTTLYTYTARDQLASVTTPDGQSITYEYDAADNKIGLHSAALDQTLTYDELNRLSDIDNRTLGGAARRNHFEYDEVGNRKLRVAADGTSTTYGYDVRNRLRTRATRSATGAILFAAVYTVDASGLRTGIAESNAVGPTRSVGYDYDGVKRLEAEAIVRPGQAARIAAYTYDAVGNRIRRETAGVVTTYEVDDNDRLIRETEAGATTLRWYDDNGNTTHRSKVGEVVEYRYDEGNRLIGAVTNGATTTIGYTADGLRNRETANGVTTTWLIDPNRDYAQTLEAYRAGQLATVWQFGDDLLAQVNLIGGSVQERTLLMDGLGSVRQVINANGAVTDAFEYDAFGEEVSRTGSGDIDHRYRAEQTSPNTGFYNLRARWYDPGIGRFSRQDDWVGKSCSPSTLNKYVYADSNPVGMLDPSGTTSLAELNISTRIESAQQSGAAFNGRLVLRKVGCELVEVAAEEAVTAVIYVFLDGVTGLPYVGQTTQGIDSRLLQHQQEMKRVVQQVLGRFEVVAEGFKMKDQMRLAEQIVIDELGGTDALSNDINAISKKRGRLRHALSKLCK